MSLKLQQAGSRHWLLINHRNAAVGEINHKRPNGPFVVERKGIIGRSESCPTLESALSAANSQLQVEHVAELP